MMLMAFNNQYSNRPKGFNAIRTFYLLKVERSINEIK